jgi:glutathione synthase/RimK-type ligase-like ATP-grasp enzyme
LGSSASQQKKRIALVTDQEWHDLSADDRVLLPVLRHVGYEVSAVPWDSDVDWEAFDLCILRSCWDYHLRINEFLRWLDRLEERRVNIMNPISTVRWNHDKRYLKDLENRGIPIVPTFLPNGEVATSLKEIMTANGWNDVIFKPCVSAAAYRTHRVRLNEADAFDGEFAAIRNDGGLLVQKFMPEIQFTGEWSFVFFDRSFSHAVLKKPAAGEFRSQDLYGGTSLSAIPEQAQVRHAGRVLDAIPGDLLYARVDMIEVDGRMLLGELEVIEPSLFFTDDADSPERFVQCLSRYI